jgi:hypothetical protein
MIDRRCFLGGVLGLALGSRAVSGVAGGSAARMAPQRPRLADDPAYRQYLADIAGCDMRVLGVPRCRLLVEEGFHPVAPGRVIVIDDAELRRFGDRHRGLKRQFLEEEAAGGSGGPPSRRSRPRSWTSASASWNAWPHTTGGPICS